MYNAFLRTALLLLLLYENDISLTCKLNSFSYERISTKTRSEEEAKGNSEMAYLFAYLSSPEHESIIYTFVQVVQVLSTL